MVRLGLRLWSYVKEEAFNGRKSLLDLFSIDKCKPSASQCVLLGAVGNGSISRGFIGEIRPWKIVSSTCEASPVMINHFSAANGVRTWRSLCTEISTTEKCETLLKEKKPFITFVLGGPGSGKGTQCIKIAKIFGFKHLSAGDLLRREILSNSDDGAMILNTIKEGRIVPSEVTVKLIKKEMESSYESKFLIDGFPRTEENRIAFEKIIGVEPDIILFFDCPQEEMVRRVLNRNEGRVDDNMSTVQKRLEVFSSLSFPVISYYSMKGKLHTINAVGTVDEIFEQVGAIFDACEALKQKS